MVCLSCDIVAKRLVVKKSAMVSLDKALTTFYRLSVVTMYSSAAVWPQFLMEDYKLYVAVS